MKIPPTGNVATRSPASSQEWQAWGEKDPLFGVIPPSGRERDWATPWTDADFYQTSRGDWAEFLQRWRRYGVERESCIEIGCGAGRLRRHIAEDFAEVHGLDVAEGMINYARQFVSSNVHLHVTDGFSLPVPDDSVTGVFSIIVSLQFDRIEDASAYFREMARALKPGGTIMIQMPLLEWPVNLKPAIRDVFERAHNKYTALRRTRGWYHRFRLSRHPRSPFMQSITYNAAWVREALSFLGFQDIEIFSFQLSRGGGAYFWVFARKASQT